MAGYMYLGSQRVCPAVVAGGSPEPEPTEYFTIKFPDSLVDFTGILVYFSNSFGLYDTPNASYLPVVIDFNKVEKVSNDNAFYGLFQDMTYKIGLKLSSIKEISGSSSFQNFCVDTEFIDEYKDIWFDNLETISSGDSLGYSFVSCDITSMHFPKLVNLVDNSLNFCGATNGIDMYFDALKSTSFQTGKELNGVARNTSGKKLHFPSNLSTVIPTLDGYPNFNGTNTTILYDLEPTE